MKTSSLSLLPSSLWSGKGRGKRKKGAVPRPPPLLLVQDAEAALVRLQERVSALLLRSRAPSPPTPTRSPSVLPGRCSAAPLWQKSTLLDEGSTCVSDFYTPELRGFITPWDPATVSETRDMFAYIISWNESVVLLSFFFFFKSNGSWD